MTIVLLSHPYAYEMECIVRLFYPGEKIAVLRDAPSTDPDTITTQVQSTSEAVRLTARVKLYGFLGEKSEEIPATLPQSEAERRLAVLLFALLCAQTNTRPQWGILTGVRPVRLCHTMMEEQGLREEQVYDTLTGAYHVTPGKARLALQTGRLERRLLAHNTPDSYSLYISIPFCPTRCLYCSFVSHAIDKTMRLVPDYVRLLCAEIRYTGKLMRDKGRRLQTIYMGGGTPTTLSEGQLAEILQAVRDSFDLSHLLEYTVEAGRPDTITADKLQALREFGVERISINPQTMDDTILRRIGRAHTAAQVEESFALARAAGIGCINMDLIAGLPGETAEGFARSMDKVLALAPENITVHTLTVKRSSTLRGQDGAFAAGMLDVSALLDTAQYKLAAAAYAPYYLYRQKGTVQNLENTGFSLPGCAGLYNVYSMEEVHTILAVGAGGVTKLCGGAGRLKRLFNYKYPYEYIARFDEILRRKSALEELSQ